MIDDLLRGPSAGVRLAAARALDDVPQNPDVERALIQARHHDPDPQIRKWALHALGCAHCKPDGVCSSDVVGEFTDALLNDRSGIVRKFAAGMMMHGQLGLDERVFAAFETVRQHPQRILRERAEYFLARHSSPLS